MSLCRECGHQNPIEQARCALCNAHLGLTCPACGYGEIVKGSRYCGRCGVSLGGLEPAQRPRERFDQRALMPAALAQKINAVMNDTRGERREVTVLFLDVVGFSATAHALDNEDLFLMTNEVMQLLAQVVYEYEGTIDKYTGDGLMALFGVPVTHENSPERAVRAALDMQATLGPAQARFREKHGRLFQTRIGINTGLVIAGQMGSDLHLEYTVIGDTVNLADRLQLAAEPDTILISAETYQRTQSLFDYEPLPPLMIKGLPSPIRAYRPIKLMEKPGRVRGLPGLQTPMVGREDALVELQQSLQSVRRHGESQVVLVTGEAGVGKSRLVIEFCAGLGGEEVSIYEGNCLAYARSRPLWLVARLLRNMLRLSDADATAAQLGVLENFLHEIGLDEADLLPFLVNLLGLPQPDPAMDDRLNRLDSSMLQEQTHAAVRRVVEAAARLAPTILVLEDLHWVDQASREMLQYLIQTTGQMGVLFILISREAERKNVIAPLITAAAKRPGRLVDIHIRALSEDESRLLVDHLVPQATVRAERLKLQIVRRAEGIPLYAEEMVRMLLAQGGLSRETGILTVTPEAEETLGQVPGTLKGLILARFDRLSDGTRRTLQMAAVLGRVFPVGLMQSVVGTALDEISSSLAEAEAHDFFDQRAVRTRQGLCVSPHFDTRGDL